jgi:hypothetical protein
MPKKPNYQCPRCGYETHQRGHMNSHFYNTKKSCPAIKNPIDLTDEIKEYILDNRIYHQRDSTNN